MPKSRRKVSPFQKFHLLIKKVINPRKKSRPIGFLLLILGLFFLLFPLVYKQIIRLQINFPRSVVSRSVNKSVNADIKSEPVKINSRLLSEKESSQPPQRVVIPNLNLDLPIIEAKVVNGIWETSETTASHGVGSANPGENGNIVVFAHARDYLFGPLLNIKTGSRIYLLTKDHWYRYRVGDIKFVESNQIETIMPTETETLTLYTCSGFLDSKRIIVRALPEN